MAIWRSCFYRLNVGLAPAFDGDNEGKLVRSRINHAESGLKVKSLDKFAIKSR